MKNLSKSIAVLPVMVRSLMIFFLILHTSVSGFLPLSNSASAGSGKSLTESYFTEVTNTVGLKSEAFAWPDGTYSLPEVIGGGVAVFDYDNDEDLDILQIRFPPPGKRDTPAANRLYQQQPDGTFSDMTAASNLGDTGYGQGVAIGDTDNDGDLDVYITNLGPDAFYRNNGDGTFTNATTKLSEAASEQALSIGWSTSAALVDYDRDDDLDLYVVGYVQHDTSRACYGDNSLQDYCNPQVFEPTSDRLYQNNGDGTFIEVSADVGINSPARGLGVICADFTNDGWVDLYVANDGEANQLWVNLGNGQFEDQAILYGLAFNTYGQPEGSMGITIGDVNQDQSLDLLLTHLTGETNTLYIATEYTIFIDGTDTGGFSGADAPFTGFGCGFLDFDNDGDLDLAVVNGRVKRGSTLPTADLGRFWNAYAEPNLLFQNDGRGIFSNVGATTETFCTTVEVNRGLAFGDIDNDGDIDLIMDRLGQSPRVFRNDAPSADHRWLLVRAQTQNRAAIGARMTLVAGDKRLVRLLLASYSYLSSNDCRVHFGLGEINRVDRIEVVWPNGQQEQFPVGELNREITLFQGNGQPL